MTQHQRTPTAQLIEDFAGRSADDPACPALVAELRDRLGRDNHYVRQWYWTMRTPAQCALDGVLPPEAGVWTADADIALARRHLEHSCDGPLTPFVLMSRACQYAARRPYAAEAAAN